MAARLLERPITGEWDRQLLLERVIRPLRLEVRKMRSTYEKTIAKSIIDFNRHLSDGWVPIDARYNPIRHGLPLPTISYMFRERDGYLPNYRPDFVLRRHTMNGRPVILEPHGAPWTIKAYGEEERERKIDGMKYGATREIYDAYVILITNAQSDQVSGHIRSNVDEIWTDIRFDPNAIAPHLDALSRTLTPVDFDVIEGLRTRAGEVRADNFYPLRDKFERISASLQFAMRPA